MDKAIEKPRSRIGGLGSTKPARDGSPQRPLAGPLDADLLCKIDAWWRAANYLSVGQTFVLDWRWGQKSKETATRRSSTEADNI